MASLYNSFTQAFPPSPRYTEKDLPDLNGRVYIVTGSNTGIGKHVARMLYSKNANVYMAARSEVKADSAIADIKAEVPSSTGSLTYLHLDLADLPTIKASANYFLAREKRLDVLINNAGVMSVSSTTRTPQGYETNLGVNCLGTFLFTKLLTPALVQTARTAPPNSVRVVWVSSSAAEFMAVNKTGVDFNNLDYTTETPGMTRYGISKAGNYLHAAEFAKRHTSDGIVSVAVNPGNLSSDLYKEHGSLAKIMMKPVLHAPVKGGYSLLYAGLSPEITIEKSPVWAIPFGRTGRIRKDFEIAGRRESEGGNGSALKFWEWSEEQVNRFL